MAKTMFDAILHNDGQSASAEETMVKADLNWDVAVEPMRLSLDGKSVPEHFAVVRQDNRNVLGIVSGKYSPLQNRDAFKAFDGVVGAGRAKYQTAGSFDGGKTVWALLSLPGAMIVKGDEIRKFGLISNGHDGGSAVKGGPTSVRVICRNTLNLALSEKENFVSVRHTGDIEARVREAFRLIGVLEERHAEMEAFFNALAERPLFGENLQNVVYTLFPSPVGEEPSTRLKNIRSKVFERIEAGRGQDNPAIRGTAWAAFNGIVEYLDHDRVVKGDEADAEAKRMENSWFGAVFSTREKAGRLIAEAVGIAL
jgi:phage/plasmid-like protein (TIGR03299 family)